MIWVVTPTAGDRARDLDCTLAVLTFEPPQDVTICLVLDAPGDEETKRIVSWWHRRLAALGHPGLHLIRHIQRAGVNRSRMEAIHAAPVGAVIVEVDDHDTPEPGALRKVCEVFSDDRVQAMYADYYLVDSRGRLTKRMRPGPYFEGLFTRVCPSNGLRAYRKSLYDAVGGYREDEFPSGDLFLWLRFAAHLEGHPEAFAYLAEPLSRMKLCPGSISVRYAREQELMADRAVYAYLTGCIL